MQSAINAKYLELFSLTLWACFCLIRQSSDLLITRKFPVTAIQFIVSRQRIISDFNLGDSSMKYFTACSFVPHWLCMNAGE